MLDCATNLSTAAVVAETDRACLDMQPVTCTADAHHVLLQDPITGHPAMMVFVHNITQQKQVEMQLAQHQEVLQRYVQPSLMLTVCTYA